MAKKQKVNKTHAVRDYLKTHRGAMSGEIAAALNKQGIKINAAHVATIKSQLNKTRTAKKTVAAKPIKASAPAPAPVTVAAEKPVKAADTFTIDQIRAVAQTVKAVRGIVRLNDLVGLIKEVGGLKKFKDLVEAMLAPEAEGIPF